MNDISAALAAPYIATFAENRNAPAEITLTIAACSLRSRCGSAACTRNTGPRRLTSNDFCHASGVNCAERLRQRVGRVVDDDVDAAEAVDGALDERGARRRARPCASGPPTRRRRPSETAEVRFGLARRPSALRLPTTTLAPPHDEALGDRPTDARASRR